MLVATKNAWLVFGKLDFAVRKGSTAITVLAYVNVQRLAPSRGSVKLLNEGERVVPVALCSW